MSTSQSGTTDRTAEYFFRFGTSAMVFVLALTFSQGARALSTLSRNPTAQMSWAWVLIELNIILVLIEILASMAEVHQDLTPPIVYRRIYLLTDVMLIIFPLYYASTALSLFFDVSPATTVSQALQDHACIAYIPVLKAGIIAIIVSFCGLALRTTVGLAPRKWQPPRLLGYYAFHAVGTLLCVWALVVPAHLLGLNIAGIALSAVFLVFFWTLRIRVGLRDSAPDPLGPTDELS